MPVACARPGVRDGDVEADSLAPALTGPAGLAVLRMWIVGRGDREALAWSRWCASAARYSEPAAGVYSARQQYLPTAAAVRPTV